MVGITERRRGAKRLPSAPNPSVRSENSRRHDGWAAVPFIAPTILGLAVFYVGPVLASLLLGFTIWNLFGAPQWVGLANYHDLFTSSLFWQVVRNTLVYIVVTVPASVVLGFLVALLLLREHKISITYRTLVFLPVVPSVVAVGLIWVWLFQPQFGPVNYALHGLGLPTPAWFSSLSWAMPALIIVSVWRNLGYNMMVFLAGLKGVSREVLEASRIDGATYWQMVGRVIVPLVSPTTFFAVIIGLVNSFQVFDLTYVMTAGGPANTTNTLAYYIYQMGFQNFDFGQASAAAYVLFLIMALLTGFGFWLERRLVFYQ